MKNLPEKNYLRPDEVAEHLGVHRRTIYRWIREGKLPAVKVYGWLLRIRKEAIGEALEKNELD